MKIIAISPYYIRQRGFSILELLVAFAIMAMSLGLLYRMAGGSARNTTDVVQQQQASWLAESILASHNTVPAGGWQEDGESAGFKWQVRSQPYNSGAQGANLVPLHRIELVVSWTMGSRPSQLELATLLPERKPGPGEVVR